MSSEVAAAMKKRTAPFTPEVGGPSAAKAKLSQVTFPEENQLHHHRQGLRLHQPPSPPRRAGRGTTSAFGALSIISATISATRAGRSSRLAGCLAVAVCSSSGFSSVPPEALMYMMGLMEDVWRAHFWLQWLQRPGAVKA